MTFTKLARFAWPAIPYMASYAAWIETCLGLVSTCYGGILTNKVGFCCSTYFRLRSFHFTFETAMDVSYLAIVVELMIMVGFRLIVVVSKSILVTSRYGKCFITFNCDAQYVCVFVSPYTAKKAFPTHTVGISFLRGCYHCFGDVSISLYMVVVGLPPRAI